MSVEHTSRIQGVIKAHLKKVSLGEAHGFAVSYGFGPVFDAQGQPTGMGWMWAVLVSIPNPLVGMQDIAASVPIPGVLPTDGSFTQAAEFLLHKCLDERTRITQMPQGASLPSPGPAMALSERPA